MFAFASSVPLKLQVELVLHGSVSVKAQLFSFPSPQEQNLEPEEASEMVGKRGGEDLCLGAFRSDCL